MNMPLIIGMGRTGKSIALWYQNQGVAYQAYDDNAPSTVDWSKVDVVHPSPGVPFNHPLYQEAINRHILIQSDAHLAQKFYPQHRYVGITGSNGKSTTAALVAHLLDGPVLLGGNIGIPILDCLPQSDDIHTFVWELSSFQLDIGQALKFDAAALLNLSPNHLDRHGTMEAYQATKLSIFDRAAWGITGIDAPEATCPLWHMNTDFSVEENHIRVGKHTFTFPKHLLGTHNHANAAFALAIALHMGTNPHDAQQRLDTFHPLPHRLELVWQGTWQGKHLRIINDSKSTTAEATRSALMALAGENVWWIGGGVAKSGGISSIAPLLTSLKQAHLIGQASEEFQSTLKASGIQQFELSHTLDKAVDQALASIQASNAPSAVLLLSPACASYDQFSDFEHRGNVFKDYIRAIPEFQNKEGTCAA